MYESPWNDFQCIIPSRAWSSTTVTLTSELKWARYQWSLTTALWSADIITPIGQVRKWRPGESDLPSTTKPGGARARMWAHRTNLLLVSLSSVTKVHLYPKSPNFLTQSAYHVSLRAEPMTKWKALPFLKSYSQQGLHAPRSQWHRVARWNPANRNTTSSPSFFSFLKTISVPLHFLLPITLTLFLKTLRNTDGKTLEQCIE